jgi:hypothetical protein
MITASDFKPMDRNTLRGFVTLRLDPSGLQLNDCSFHHKNGKEWIGLPGKAQIDHDGQLKKNPASGKILYLPTVEIPNKAASDRFQKAALHAVHKLLGEREGGS